MRMSESLQNEPRWAGVKEVMVMSGPIVLGSLSYTVMEFCDKVMVAQLGTNELAAAGSAGLWSYTLGTVFLGVVGCVSTFVSQALGRGEKERCARYAWAGIYLSIVAGLLALLLWPLSGPLFQAMNHSPEVTALELDYFRIRLFGYVGIAWTTALAAFFQAVDRPMIPTYVALIGNAVNLVLNYLLIFGKGGFPELELAGAAVATVIALSLQALLLTYVFLNANFNAQYNTRAAWSIDLVRIRELVRIGLPNGATFFLDVANWAIFTSFIVGYFGAVDLAAHNIAISLMHLSFMPAMAINQGIAPIVGKWIGRNDYARAKSRAYTALKITASYMLAIGVINASFGGFLIRNIFSDDPAVIHLGHMLLILAAIFQGFDAINIVCAGALRGAGDTRWMMIITFFSAYCIFLPLALYLAFVANYQTYGAWIGATVFIIVLSSVMFWRWHSERWRFINIFSGNVPAALESPIEIPPNIAAENALPIPHGPEGNPPARP